MLVYRRGVPGFPSLRDLPAMFFFKAKKEEERRLQEAQRKKLQEAGAFGARITGRLGKSSCFFFQ